MGCHNSPMTHDAEKLAYIAGFFDGEGCVSVHIRHTRNVFPSTSPRLTITQKDPRTLLWIQEYLGMGYLSKRTKSGCHVLQIGALADVVRFAELIGPYTRDKKAKLTLAVKMANTQYNQRHLVAEEYFQKFGRGPAKAGKRRQP